ncbi:MAG: AAA family ATPase [Candidatus Melainabacteria bacterium]|nr:AAA family ATPase [Candidatus Melainabacteria bacterium]
MGKTTLAQVIASQLGLEIIPEIARQLCKSMGYERIGEIPDQEGFKHQVLSLQIETEEHLVNFVSDRSTIDCWVLWQRWNICTAMTYDTESYYELARKQSTKYTRIIYIPPLFVPQEDRFRWTNLDYQKQIDRLVRMTLYEWGLLERTCIVQSAKLEDRVKEVSTWLTNR